MDLRKFDSITLADKGVELVLDPKTATNPGAGIFLHGADSAAHKAKRREIDLRNSERRSPPSPDDIEAQTFEILVACTKGWHGLIEDGKELVFSPAEAEKLYRNYPEIRYRVADFIFTRANFFPTASAN